ncbi:MAG: flagellar export chaperone FliS [Planctomycetaceae bacterium]|nr:flagellar export chaperone FliS [Planctomycetaceae bacterium]
MQPQDATAAYREASLENAPPIKIVRMLYQGALRNIEKSRRALEQEDQNQFVEGLHKTDAIVAELRFCLDHAAAPELSLQLESLYLFAEERLAVALEQRNIGPADEAGAVLRQLLSAWTSLEIDGATAA